MSAPWFIGGGAEHSPEIARLLAYTATRGNEGIITPGDYKVEALSVAAGGVRIAPGAGLINNRSAGGGRQTYVTRRAIESTLDIAPTDASGGRSDLIIQRIEDPQYAPWQPPPDYLTATFDPFVVLQGVDPNLNHATGRGYPALLLARIDIPASTSAITQAMIKDFRKVANPRRERILVPRYPTSTLTLTTTFQTLFEIPGGVAVPPWATKAFVRGDIGGIVLRDATSNGEFRFNFGGVLSQTTALTEEANRRMSTFTGGLLDLPAGVRGASGVAAQIQGREMVASTARWQVDAYSTGFLDIEFQEAAV